MNAIFVLSIITILVLYFIEANVMYKQLCIFSGGIIQRSFKRVMMLPYFLTGIIFNVFTSFVFALFEALMGLANKNSPEDKKSFMDCLKANLDEMSYNLILYKRMGVIARTIHNKAEDINIFSYDNLIHASYVISVLTFQESSGELLEKLTDDLIEYVRQNNSIIGWQQSSQILLDEVNKY